jgi:peptidyl-prolyl cis-trans isomerase SurA
MQPGQVSRPIRTLTGYYILFLANRQAGKSDDVNDLSVKYRQMTAPVTSGAPQAEIEAQRQLAIKVASNANSCEELLQQARQVGARDMEAIHEVAVADLTPWQRKYLLSNDIGQASPPTRTPKGFLIMMPCERTQQAAGIPSAKALEERMTRERLELMAQKYMRDLRRSAYIDLRQ